jgi:hypothetical protein
LGVVRQVFLMLSMPDYGGHQPLYDFTQVFHDGEMGEQVYLFGGFGG